MAQPQRGNVFGHLPNARRPQTSRPRSKLDEAISDDSVNKGNDEDESNEDDNGKVFDSSEPFLLSDLVGDLNLSGDSNYFHFPTGAKTFLRHVLSPGPDFRFVSMGRKTECEGDDSGNGNNADNTNRVAFISSCLDSHDVHINLAFPPQRVGEAICHEMLHHEDFSTSGFRPITSIVYCKPAGLRGAAATAVCQDAPTKAFQPLIAELVNLISHEYVKAKLEAFGYSHPFVPAMENQLASIRFMMRNLEQTMCSLSEQLAKVGGGLRRKGKIKVGIYKLQSMYENLILVALMDELLFKGEYTHQIDAMLLTRFQNVLDYVLDCTSPSSDNGRSFHGVHRQVGVVAGVVRVACKRYRTTVTSGSIVGHAEDRYKLLLETLNSTYDAVGVQFALLARAKDDAPSIRLEAASGVLREDDSFLLDGGFSFVDAKAFTAIS